MRIEATDCSEEGCPFNYDTNQCKAITDKKGIWMSLCDMGRSKPFSGEFPQKCPLQLVKEILVQAKKG